MMRFFKLTLLLCVFCTSCDEALLGEEGHILTYEENIQPPEQLNDGLEVSTLEAEGIDESAIHDIVAYLQENESFYFRGMLIARNNKLVHESYYHGWNKYRKQDLRSATKSITSTVVGIAIDKGFIESVDEPILSFFDYESYDNWHEHKEEMTIRNFLQMRTGLACNDDSENSPGNQQYIYPNQDWIKYVLDLPVLPSGGTPFSYCTGAPITLGVVVENATGMPFDEFAHKYLLGPLGATDYNWEIMRDGRVSAGGQMSMIPRDALKFGLLILNDGVWKGQRLVSEEWIAEATQPYDSTSSRRFGYGYLWWVNTWEVQGVEIPAFFGRGNGGQMIVVVPGLDAVILLTGGYYSKSWMPSRLNIVGRILSAFN